MEGGQGGWGGDGEDGGGMEDGGMGRIEEDWEDRGEDKEVGGGKRRMGR